MASKKTTHVRVERDIVSEFNTLYPGVRHADIIKMSWQMYKGVQKVGTMMYGKKIWNQPKKK